MNESTSEKSIAHNTIAPKDAYVLVVEDNLQNLVLVARLLAFIGIRRYEWKASGWQVLEFADTMPRVDLVLMDLQLPYEDGYNALRKLRSDNRFADTRIVAVTADTSPASMKKAKEAGFDGFLGKPIDPDHFPDQIVAILQGQPVWELNEQQG